MCGSEGGFLNGGGSYEVRVAAALSAARAVLPQLPTWNSQRPEQLQGAQIRRNPHADVVQRAVNIQRAVLRAGHCPRGNARLLDVCGNVGTADAHAPLVLRVCTRALSTAPRHTAARVAKLVSSFLRFGVLF